MKSQVAIVSFPGSNCEHDVVEALGRLGVPNRIVWHTETDLSDFSGVIVPGGFAHGDYLRPGAIARFSPVMAGVVAMADRGAPVLGICNGFQVLTEAGLLPGALQKNAGLSFLCENSTLLVCSRRSILTKGVALGTELVIPINHFEGNYICDADELKRLQDHDQIVLRYQVNPNGSLDNIAGISSRMGNVVGLMPHPERASDELLGSVDGLVLLRSFIDHL